MKIKFTNGCFLFRKQLLFQIMRTFIILFSTTLFGFTPINSYSQAKIAIDKDEVVTVDRVFNMIRKQTNYAFIYPKKLLNNSIKVQLKKGEIELVALLDRTFESSNFKIEVSDDETIVLKELPKNEPPSHEVPVTQGIEIMGVVTDAYGEPLPGANILEKGTNNGVIADMDGTYSINVGSRDAVLVFSYLGMATVERTVGGNPTVNVALNEDAEALNEVVVTALGIKREAKSLSYSTQEVNPDALNETKDPNIVNSLSGQVAGVQVVPSGFNTGSARIIIRGNSSLTGNNQPLFVVDGMPIDNAPGDGNLDYGNNASDINPQDVESIQVLKGPNAAALYGSRAANGVILITTKKGSGDFKVVLNSSTMFQTLTEFPEYQNAYGVGTSFYIDNRNTLPKASVNYRSWGSPMLGQPYVALDGKVRPYLPQPDNVKDFYVTAALLTNSIALEGGNAKNNYRLSYTNLNGTSVVKRFNENSRNTLSLVMQNNLSDRFTLNGKINYIRDDVENRQYSNSNGRNPTNMYTHMARSTNLSELIPYKDEITGLEIGTHRNFSNPYWIVNENSNGDVKDRIIASFNPEVRIAEGLRFTGRLGADMYWWQGFEFNNIGAVIQSNPDGFMRTFNTGQQHFNTEGIFSANKKFGDFSLVAILGASSFKSKYEKREQRINSLLQPGLINISNAKEFPSASQNIRERKINSLFSSVSLGYKDYAFVDVTGRNDWSSTLPQKNNSYFYPSLGGSLIISDLFHLKSNFLSFAKFRGSYAMVGNDTDPYSLNQTYSFNGFFDGAPLSSLSTTMNNPDLKPELTSSTEFGLNLRMFKNRFSIDATWYAATTTNQIIEAQLPASSGFEQRLYNAGEITNTGFEAHIKGLVFDMPRFTWEAQVNYAKNNSEVVSLLDDITRFQLGGSSRLGVYAEVGKPYGYLRGLGVLRDDQGRMLLEQGGGRLMADNDKPFGTANPDFIASLRNTFTLGNLDLQFLLDYKKGGILYSQSMSRMLVNGVHKETLETGRDEYYLHSVIWGESSSELTGGAIWDAYYEDGTPNTRYMSPQSYEYARPNYAEFVIYDASFLKIRELAIGYNFSNKLLARTPLKKARLSLIGRNLAILHRNTPLGIDPESSTGSGNAQGMENGGLPPNAIYGLNINLTF